MASSWIRHTVAATEAGLELQAILTGPMGLSRRMIQRLTRASGIRLNGRAPYLKRAVKAGDVVAVRVAFEENAGVVPVAMELVIPYEDEHLLVVDKPAGLLVHPLREDSAPTLVHGLAHHLESGGVRSRLRPVHRLDRETSGLLLIALTAFAHQALDRQLRERSLRRHYLALVEGVIDFEQRTVELPIGRAPGRPHLRAVDPAGDPALTRVRVIERFARATLLEAELDTGRTHQIRVHLAHLGHPLIGDRQYGARMPGSGRQALHAARLEFRHPLSGATHTFESPLPADLAAVRTKLEEALG